LDKAVKYGLALMLVGIALLFIPFGPQASTTLSTFFGESPWLTGQTGTKTTGTGQATLLATGVVNFKMSLVAAYADNTPNETIFEKASMPGLSVISIHNHPLKAVTAYALAAVLTNQPLPSGSVGNFKLNFTVYNEKLGKAKFRYIEMNVPLVSNGTLALAALAPLSVLPTEVYPEGSTTSGTVESRRMDWILNAHVEINAPGYQTLSLIGSTLSYADFNSQGGFDTGCTNCGGSGGTIGGGSFTGGKFYLDNPEDFCSAYPNNAKCVGTPPHTATTAGTVVVTETATGTSVVVVTTTVGTVKITTVTPSATATTRTITSGTVAVKGGSPPGGSFTVDPTGTEECKTTACRKVGNTVIEQTGSTEWVDVGEGMGLTGTGIRLQPGEKVALEVLPLGPSISLSWYRLDLGSEVYLINPATFILVGLGLLIVVALAYPYLASKKPR
jgi:hypothetical protein